MAETASKLPIWFIILIGILFSVNSLCSCMVAALAGAGKWDALDGTAKFIIVICIIGNWTGTLLAFGSRAVERYLQGKTPLPPADVFGGGAQSVRTYEEKSTKTTVQPIGPAVSALALVAGVLLLSGCSITNPKLLHIFRHDDPADDSREQLERDLKAGRATIGRSDP